MVSKTGAYNWYDLECFLSMSFSHKIRRYICLVAAGCMVLMGYDASVFNSVQNSNNWTKYFDNPVLITYSLDFEIYLTYLQNSYMLGLLNTVYTVGGIITGWFFAGPLVGFTVCLIFHI